MCTSKPHTGCFGAGFTLVELLVALALSVCLALALAPFWISLMTAGTRETDRTVWLIQQRVAAARLERDLRLAGAEGCLFPAAGALLEASGSQVVFLQRAADGSAPLIVEWEIARGSLMRRWGSCPVHRPVVLQHSLYEDNKTMLEDVGAGSSFTYVVAGAEQPAPVGESDLGSVETVVLNLRAGGAVGPVAGGAGAIELTTPARVSR
ncbi:MAG: prepilin-type N-terminal cleavage/methylation domain-containing protein [Thermoleophilia bacterium]|nr:prepilin-type N-terminal cleavage/methylation domain-containing protein [Thermoleophilia bacterium]